MKNIMSYTDLERLLGENIKKLRLQKAISQHDLSEQAGISVSALKNLENGEGASVKTLIRTLKALNQESWVESIAPIVTINPLHMTQNKAARQRAPRSTYGKKEKN